MGRKARISYEDKIKACEDYLNGTASAREIAERLNLSARGKNRMYEWANTYRECGPKALLPKLKNSTYTKELKINAVEDYLSDKGSIE